MIGLGPNGTSLLERTSHAFELTLDWLEMDRSERGQLRRAAGIRYGMKHKKQQKPLAPVEEVVKQKGVPRSWRWMGEDIESKALYHKHFYREEYIREQGFRLPKLKKIQKVKL